MELDREAMRLVPDALEKLQLGRVVGKSKRRAAAGHVHLLDPLGEADHRNPEIEERCQFPDTGGQLSRATVDHDQGGHRREALVEFAVVRAALTLSDVLGHSP